MKVSRKKDGFYLQTKIQPSDARFIKEFLKYAAPDIINDCRAMLRYIVGRHICEVFVMDSLDHLMARDVITEKKGNEMIEKINESHREHGKILDTCYRYVCKLSDLEDDGNGHNRLRVMPAVKAKFRKYRRRNN